MAQASSDIGYVNVQVSSDSGATWQDIGLGQISNPALAELTRAIESATRHAPPEYVPKKLCIHPEAIQYFVDNLPPAYIFRSDAGLFLCGLLAVETESVPVDTLTIEYGLREQRL